MPAKRGDVATMRFRQNGLPGRSSPPTSISRWSFALLLSEFLKLPLKMVLEHLGGVDQCLQGNFVACPLREQKGRFRHPNGPVATVWSRLERQGCSQQDLEETGTELLLFSIKCQIVGGWVHRKRLRNTSNGRLFCRYGPALVILRMTGGPDTMALR
jgi:hypothetical protein